MSDIRMEASNRPSVALRGRILWRVSQTLAWAIGAGILLALVIVPWLGLHAFWNVLIPLAPALLVFFPGPWRNLCPLGSTALFGRHLGLSSRRRISPRWHGHLGLLGVLLLLGIVPLRHVVLDLSGPATALTIAGLACLGILLGLRFEAKSGWCSGLCPVHPVEKLYGQAPFATVGNAHCSTCELCVSHCPDSRPATHLLEKNLPRQGRVATTLMAGGFAGFVWGWFHVPNNDGTVELADLGLAYGLPLAGLAVSLTAFVLLRRVLHPRHETLLLRSFATAAITCYYWYRIPALFGFGLFPGDGMLVDLTGHLPSWFPLATRVVTSGLFIWWLLVRQSPDLSWNIRPRFRTPPFRTLTQASGSLGNRGPIF